MREKAAHYSTSQTEVRTLRLGVERQSDEETGEREKMIDLCCDKTALLTSIELKLCFPLERRK